MLPLYGVYFKTGSTTGSIKKLFVYNGIYTATPCYPYLLIIYILLFRWYREVAGRSSLSEATTNYNSSPELFGIYG